jgi:hypothetical protein
MANNTETQKAAAVPAMTKQAAAVLVLGWLIPGAGHLLLKRWWRGLLIMAAIFILFFVGLGMQGKVYSFNTGDLLDMLGFVGDIGAGLLYMVAHVADWGQGAINRATADYGTKYIVVAGLLNIMAAIDAYHIALGKKQ